MPAEGTTAQINKNLKFLMDLLGQKDIIKTRQKGYKELETQQHENMLARARDKFNLQIAQDPAVNRLMSQINLDKIEGKTTKDLENELKVAVDDIVGLVHSTSTGQAPTEEMWRTALGKVSDMSFRELLAQTATGARQEKEIPLERGRQILGAGRLELDRAKFMQKEREIKAEIDQIGQQSLEDQLDAWTDIVKDSINFLESEGVKKTSASSAMRALFTSGKVLDPLSAENRGQAFGYLTMIQSKLAKGQLPSEGEEWFLMNVRNSPVIGRTGIVSPVEIDSVARYMMEKHGYDKETAYDLARRFILTKRGQPERR